MVAYLKTYKMCRVPKLTIVLSTTRVVGHDEFTCSNNCYISTPFDFNHRYALTPCLPSNIKALCISKLFDDAILIIWNKANVLSQLKEPT